MKPYPPLEITPYSLPSPHIVRFGNGRANLGATLAGMEKGQTILIRMASKADLTRVTSVAANAKVRIKIEEHPAMFTIRVTSLGPWRKRGVVQVVPLSRKRCFKPVPSAQPGLAAETGPGPVSEPGPVAPDETEAERARKIAEFLS